MEGQDLPCTPGLQELFWLVLLFQQLGDAPSHVWVLESDFSLQTD